MEHSNGFNLKDNINNWEKELRSSPVYTNADIEELKAHLLDLYDNFLEQDFTEEEAFLIAITRIGRSVDWNLEFEQSNRHVFDLQKAAIVLSGIFFYFFSYYLIKNILDGIFIIQIARGENALQAIANMQTAYWGYLIFVVIFFIILLFGKSKFLLQKLSRIKINPRHIIIAFTVTVSLAVGNHYMQLYIFQNIPNGYQIADYSHIIYSFNYAYPFIILLGLIYLVKRIFK